MELEESYCQEILQEELRSRKQKNSSYSMRAFARDLGIGSTSLSECLSLKRKLSQNNIQNIAEVLQLSPLQKAKLLAESSRSRRKTEVDQEDDINRLRLADDHFRMISEWYYVAILNLARLENNSADPNDIAIRLGITVEEAMMALSRLVRMDYLQIVDGQLMRSAKPISTPADVPSTAVKKYHSANLKLAEEALWNTDVQLREVSSITMPVDIAKIPEVKSLLMTFKRKMARVLSQGEPSEVYTLSFQLFPITQTKAD